MFSYAKQKLLHEYAASFGDFRGSIQVYAEGIVLRTPTGEVPVRSGYVEAISRTGPVLLGKIPVELAYYDMFGNRELVLMRMRETDWMALRNDLGK